MNHFYENAEGKTRPNYSVSAYDLIELLSHVDYLVTKDGLRVEFSKQHKHSAAKLILFLENIDKYQDVVNEFLDARYAYQEQFNKCFDEQNEFGKTFQTDVKRIAEKIK